MTAKHELILQCPTAREALRNSEESYKLSEAMSHDRPDLYPLPRAYHTGVMYQNKCVDEGVIKNTLCLRLIIYGGHGMKMASSNLWHFDVEKGQWVKLSGQGNTSGESTSADPGCRFGLVSCVYEDGMFISGGQQNSKLVNGNLWRLDLKNYVWQQVSTSGQPPSART